MKQQKSIGDLNQRQQMFVSVSFYVNQLGKGFLGGVWLFLLTCFVLFIIQYNRYHYIGVRQGNKSYALVYKDMDKIARKLVCCFLAFLAMTYCVAIKEMDAFVECVKLGVLFNLALSPLYYSYFGDQHEFKFKKL